MSSARLKSTLVWAQRLQDASRTPTLVRSSFIGCVRRRICAITSYFDKEVPAALVGSRTIGFASQSHLCLVGLFLRLGRRSNRSSPNSAFSTTTFSASRDRQRRVL